MANKRANPFVDDFVQQSKIHVGLKQFNNNEDRLQKVYEKTLELLFKGAKKSPVQETQISSSEPVSPKKDKMKQLVLGKNCTLENSGLPFTKILLSCHLPKVPNKVTSADCKCGTTSVESQCAYCETELCSMCQHSCSRCQLQFCSQCSLVGFEGSEICVSCYD